MFRFLGACAAFQQVSGVQDMSPVPFWGAVALTWSFLPFCTESSLFFVLFGFQISDFQISALVVWAAVLSCWDFVMNGESKKQEDIAKALSNLWYTALMGTPCDRCSTIEKSKYCFASLGSFSSCHLTGSSREYIYLFSLPSLSGFW